MLGVFNVFFIAMFQLGASANAAHNSGSRQSLLRAEIQNHQGRTETNLTKSYPFYHSTQELADEVRKLADGCRVPMTVDTESHGDVSIDAAYLSKSSSNKTKTRLSMITGEHARELIGPETALHFLRMLCGDVSADGVDVDAILEHTDFQVIFNANPLSRQGVEKGHFCIRANPRGVDLNRNWDERFLEGDGGQTPFSESETIISRNLLSSYKPDVFMSIHSGTLGLYMPWAFSSSEADPLRNRGNMMSLLQDLDESFCKCPYGGAARNVGYDCPGTSIDWVYDHLNASYSFAFEIFVESSFAESVRMEWKDQHESASMLGISSHALSHEYFRDFFEQHHSDFVHHNGSALLEVDADDVYLTPEVQEMCLTHYNPMTTSDFDATLQNWGLAYLRTAQVAGALGGADSGPRS